MAGAAVAEVAAICGQAGSAWLAVCGLHERAEELGVHTSVWDGDNDDHLDAEAVKESLERFIEPPDGTQPTSGTDYEPESVSAAIAGLATPMDLGRLSHVVATVLDGLYWPNFTRDWLADRGQSSNSVSGSAIRSEGCDSWARWDTALVLIGSAFAMANSPTSASSASTTYA